MKLLSIITTNVVFGLIGFFILQKVRKNISYNSFFLYLLLSIVFYFTGTDTALFSISGFEIMQNHVFGSFFFGSAISAFIILKKQKKTEDQTTP